MAGVEEKQSEAEKRVDRLVRDLEREILELKGGQAKPDLLQDDKKQFTKVNSLHLQHLNLVFTYQS